MFNWPMFHLESEQGSSVILITWTRTTTFSHHEDVRTSWPLQLASASGRNNKLSRTNLQIVLIAAVVGVLSEIFSGGVRSASPSSLNPYPI